MAIFSPGTRAARASDCGGSAQCNVFTGFCRMQEYRLHHIEDVFDGPSDFCADVVGPGLHIAGVGFIQSAEYDVHKVSCHRKQCELRACSPSFCCHENPSSKYRNKKTAPRRNAVIYHETDHKTDHKIFTALPHAGVIQIG